MLKMSNIAVLIDYCASYSDCDFDYLKGTVKLYFDFSEKDTFITGKRRDVFVFLKFDPKHAQNYR